MLYGLRIIDFSQKADMIERHWEQLLITSGAQAEAEYFRCYPETLLERIAVRAYEGVYESGFQVVSPRTDLPVYNILNQAWQIFWEKPNSFSRWEQRKVGELQKLANGQLFGPP